MSVKSLLSTVLFLSVLGLMSSNAFAWGETWTTSPFGNGFLHQGSNGQSWTSMPFGSGWIHNGPNGQSHTTMPFGNGWITRGMSIAPGVNPGSWNIFDGGRLTGSISPGVNPGSWNIFDGGRLTGTISPGVNPGSWNMDFRGQPAPANWDVFRGWTSMPNQFGGFYYSGPNGQSITSMPNQFGGFYYSGPNGLSGNSMPNQFGGFDYSGDLFRGGQQKSVFTNNTFKGKINEIAIQAAIRARNINALLSSAWDLKGFETISNAKDENLNSEKLFNLAATFAVEQNNAEALKAVIALAPECKKYEEQLAFKAQTRGAQKKTPAIATPELVCLPVENWEKVLKEDLKPWQQPVGDFYLCGMFRGMAMPAAANAASLINFGRIDMKPIMIAIGAAELANYDYRKEFAPWFEPASIMSEAVELAIALKDKNALEEISAIFEKSRLKLLNPEFASYISDQIALFGNTRGQQVPASLPGDFSLPDVRKFLDFGF